MKIILYFALTCGGLLWGAVTDHKRREIENGVHILVLLGGLFSGLSLLNHILGFFLPPILWALMNRARGKSSGAGDIKLMAALGFNAGIFMLFGVLLLSAILLIPRYFKEKKREFPVCTYIFCSYICVWMILLPLRISAAFSG